MAHRDPEGEKLLATRARVDLSESSVVSQVVKTGRPVAITSTSAKQMRSFMSDKMGAYLDRFGLSGLLLVPMSADGRVIGCMALLRVEGGAALPVGGGGPAAACWPTSSRMAAALGGLRSEAQRRTTAAGLSASRTSAPASPRSCAATARPQCERGQPGRHRTHPPASSSQNAMPGAASARS